MYLSKIMLDFSWSRNDFSEKSRSLVTHGLFLN